jgi:hypothetical protein
MGQQRRAGESRVDHALEATSQRFTITLEGSSLVRNQLNRAMISYSEDQKLPKSSLGPQPTPMGLLYGLFGTTGES